MPDLQDPAVFQHTEGMMIVTHVDDFLVAGPTKKVNEVMVKLKKEFKMTVQNALDGKEHTFLGRSLQWLKPGHVVFGVGEAYIEEAFKELKMVRDVRMKRMPLWIKQRGCATVLDETQQSRHTSMLGKMVWLDRPDIRPAVIRLGSQLGKATEDDMKNAERIWSYLFETKEQVPMILR